METQTTSAAQVGNVSPHNYTSVSNVGLYCNKENQFPKMILSMFTSLTAYKTGTKFSHLA